MQRGKENDKANFNKLWSKILKERDKFGARKMKTTTTTTITAMIIRVILTLRLLMSYIYGSPILDVSRSHTTTQHSR